ncbi:hypothetical protein C8Q75DRAFT_695938, partial [Abortiporus biennis]
MPHKRAKKSLRDKEKSQSGSDLPISKHSIANEEVPKGAARILNAAKVQAEYQKKRKLNGEDDGNGARSGGNSKKKRKLEDESGKAMQILPGESLGHFNRRVENSMKGLVKTAMQDSSAVARKARKEEEERAKNAPSSVSQAHSTIKPIPTSQKPTSKLKPEYSSEHDDADEKSKSSKTVKEFASVKTSAPKRLNDIVQAPPQLNKPPRAAKRLQMTNSEIGSRSLRDGVLSMAQKAMLEEERERAIRLYREMKKK